MAVSFVPPPRAEIFGRQTLLRGHPGDKVAIKRCARSVIVAFAYRSGCSAGVGVASRRPRTACAAARGLPRTHGRRLLEPSSVLQRHGGMRSCFATAVVHHRAADWAEIPRRSFALGPRWPTNPRFTQFCDGTMSRNACASWRCEASWYTDACEGPGGAAGREGGGVSESLVRSSAPPGPSYREGQ